MADRARSFAPTVLAGLAGAVVAAVAAGRTWATASGSAAGVHVRAGVTGSDAAPLALALALVSLAAWGVVLVVRGTARRVVAGIGAAAALGVVAATVAGFGRAHADATDAAVAKGAARGVVEANVSGWYYLTVLGGVLALAGFVVAVAAAPRWPAMGSRYDAPRAPGDRGTGPAVTDTDMWRALDDGRDPTE
jgi:uncharacterized membrane protein (TIGR02234 family)